MADSSLDVERLIRQHEFLVGKFAEAVAALVERRITYLAGHSRRVADIALDMARHLGMPESAASAIHLAGMLHDAGMYVVPAEILMRSGPLRPEEAALVRTHVSEGHVLLRSIPFDADIAAIVLQHHERMDGSGYPLGISGDQILPEARILAVADALDAASTQRPYRPARPREDVLRDLRLSSGKLDRDMVELAVRIGPHPDSDTAAVESGPTLSDVN